MSNDSMIIDAHAGDDLSSLAGRWEVDPTHSALEFVCRYAMFTLVPRPLHVVLRHHRARSVAPEATEISVDIDPSSVDTSDDRPRRAPPSATTSSTSSAIRRSPSVPTAFTLLGAGRYVVHGDLMPASPNPCDSPSTCSVGHRMCRATRGSASRRRRGCNAVVGTSRGTPRCSAVASPWPTMSTSSWTCRSSRPGRSAGPPWRAPTRPTCDRFLSVGGCDAEALPAGSAVIALPILPRSRMGDPMSDQRLTPRACDGMGSIRRWTSRRAIGAQSKRSGSATHHYGHTRAVRGRSGSGRRTARLPQDVHGAGPRAAGTRRSA